MLADAALGVVAPAAGAAVNLLREKNVTTLLVNAAVGPSFAMVLSAGPA